MPTEEELSRGFAIGEWEVLPARGELRAGNRIETPEPKVFKVLLALAARGGDVVTKDDLVDAAWDGRATSDDAIVRAVHQLRGHLGDKERPYRYVDTLHRRGYRLKQNVVLHEDASSGDETGARKIRRRPWLAVGVAVAAIAIAATWLGGRDGLEAPVGSIGVLPFENLSGDPTQQYLVSGFKHELVKTLSNIPDFLVKDVQDPYVGLEVSDIAMRLGVESVLFGGLQREGDLLKVNYHVARGSDGITMSSGSITVSMDNIFGGQERLAETVRNDLLGESQQRLLSSSRPESTAGLDRYMRGLHAFRQRGQPGKLEQAMRLFEETITIDPSFGPAYLELAMAYALLPDARNAPLDEAHETAMAVVEQGIAADPSIRDAADAVVGFVHHKRKNWTRAEEAYLRAIGAPIVDSNAYNWYSLMLSGVGRLDAALEQALEAQRIDPSHGVINSRVAIAYTWLDQGDRAQEFYERAEQLGGIGTTHLLSKALLLHRQGRHDEALQSTIEAVSMAAASSDWIEAAFSGLHDRTRRTAALAALDGAAADEAISPQTEITLRAMLDDVDGALRVARGVARRDARLELDVLFLPELLPLRQRPEFLELMENLGIAEYWEASGCIWQETAVKCPEAL